MSIADEPHPAGERSPFAYPTREVATRLTTCSLALRFAAAEGLHPEDLANKPVVLDQGGVPRWPRGPDAHRRPAVDPGGVRSSISGDRDYFRFYSEGWDGLIKRDFDHPQGRFGIGVHDSSLRIEAGLGGGAAVFRAVGRHCTVHIPELLPLSLRISLKGMDLNDVVAHAFFSSWRLRIASVVATPRGVTRITVYDEPVRITVLTHVRVRPIPCHPADDDDIPF